LVCNREIRFLNTNSVVAHPSVLLKLYIYGYLNRVQSSRRLEREACRNVEVMWLAGRLVPDHKTIADFRKDNGPCDSQAGGRTGAVAGR
jgi:transposase